MITRVNEIRKGDVEKLYSELSEANKLRLLFYGQKVNVSILRKHAESVAPLVLIVGMFAFLWLGTLEIFSVGIVKFALYIFFLLLFLICTSIIAVSIYDLKTKGLLTPIFRKNVKNSNVDFIFICAAFEKIQEYNRSKEQEVLTKAKAYLMSYCDGSSLIWKAKRELFDSNAKVEFLEYGNMIWRRFWYPFLKYKDYSSIKRIVLIPNLMQTLSTSNYLDLLKILEVLRNLEYINIVERKNGIIKDRLIAKLKPLIEIDDNEIEKILNSKESAKKITKRKVEPFSESALNLLLFFGKVISNSVNSTSVFICLMSWYFILQLFSFLSAFIWCSFYGVNFDTKILGIIISVPIAGAIPLTAMTYSKEK